MNAHLQSAGSVQTQTLYKIEARWPKYRTNIIFPNGLEFEEDGYQTKYFQDNGITQIGFGQPRATAQHPHLKPEPRWKCPVNMVFTVGHLRAGEDWAGFDIKAHKKYNYGLVEPFSIWISLKQWHGTEYGVV